MYTIGGAQMTSTSAVISPLFKLAHNLSMESFVPVYSPVPSDDELPGAFAYDESRGVPSTLSRNRLLCSHLHQFIAHLSASHGLGLRRRGCSGSGSVHHHHHHRSVYYYIIGSGRRESLNSQEPNKYVRLKRARITKAVALTRKSVCPRATGLYLAQIQSRVKINEKIIHGETRSHFISFSSSKGPHTHKKLSCVALSLLSLSLSLSPPFVQIFYSR